jgi:hypothetical protein
MTSELKSATARANGAKSRGPKSPETREKSSRNSIQHGFTARKTVVLECENNDEFHEILADYVTTYQPGSRSKATWWMRWLPRAGAYYACVSSKPRSSIVK